LLIRYLPPPATEFLPDELSQKQNRPTQQSYVNSKVVHPCSAVVEYPQTSLQLNEAIAHIFKIDPSKSSDHKGNIQYSLGGTHGAHSDVECFLLKGQDGL